VIIIIIIINVLIKVTLNELRCRGTLQSQWSTLTESTSKKLKNKSDRFDSGTFRQLLGQERTEAQITIIRKTMFKLAF